MKRFLICCILFLGGMSAACKKKTFTHTKVETVTSCTLCEQADSISGTYKGLAVGFWPTVPNNSDTMYVTLEHVFLNLTPDLDSSVMFFNVQSWYASGGSITHSTAALQQSDGEFWNNQNNAELRCLRVDHDTLYLESHTSSDPWSQSVFQIRFKGVKQ